MKHRIGLYLIALGLAACSQGAEEPIDTTEQAAESAGVVAAETPEAAEGKHHKQRDPKKLIEKLDENQNGILELTELPDRKRRWLESADTDKSGGITAAELEAHKKQMGERHFKHGRRGFGKDPARMIEKLDANQNGSLEVSELPEHKREKLGAADADKDGKLSAEELKSHFQSRMKKRGEHFRKSPDRTEQAL